ncbi:MAG: aspartate aminotransferase family protein [Gammaproteobacteria bacterium]|nr:MAG: aspartate aminotransferase family protein [Gammaproteobacteria bacterium]
MDNATFGGAQDLFYSPSPEFPRPTFIKGEGIYLWDIEGKKYLDASSGPATCNIGHSNPQVLKAMAEQAQQLCFSFASTARNLPNIELSQRLTQLAGKGFERALFVSGGSLAVDMAIKFCRQYRYATGEIKRTKLISCQPSYHGMTLGCLAVSGDPAFDEIYSEMITTSSKIEPVMSYRRPSDLSENDYAILCAKQLEQQIISQGKDNVLAFIVEPVGGSSTGAIAPPEIYFQEVRNICNKYGVFLIYDEVLSGSGRTGTFLTHHQWSDATPDIVVLAKGLGAGYYPLGAMLTSAKLVEELSSLTGFNYAHTYNASPLACAVGNAVLQEISNNQLLENTVTKGNYLRRQLISLQQNSKIIGDVRGRGLLLAIELVANKQTKEQLPFEYQATEQFKKLALENGLFIYGRRSNNGKYGEHVLVSPPLNINQEEVDRLIELLALTINKFEQQLSQLRLI